MESKIFHFSWSAIHSHQAVDITLLWMAMKQGSQNGLNFDFEFGVATLNRANYTHTHILQMNTHEDGIDTCYANTYVYI